jgi:hypothetical protein
VDSQQFQEDKRPPTVPLSSISNVFEFDDTGGYGSGTELRFLVLDFARARRLSVSARTSSLSVVRVGRWVVTRRRRPAPTGEYNPVTMLKNRSLPQLGRSLRGHQDHRPGLAVEHPQQHGDERLRRPPAIAERRFRRHAGAHAARRCEPHVDPPSLAALAPVKAYGNTNLTVTGGNSQLEPLLSDNRRPRCGVVLHREIRAGSGSFYKDVDSFISSPTTQSPSARRTVPPWLRCSDAAAVAGSEPDLDLQHHRQHRGTKLEGFEIAYQQSFTGLPGFWGNFGFNGNYSYVDAETTVVRSGREVTVPLQGMSNNSWNGTLFYETPRWGSRVSVNNRDDYITNNLGQNGNISEATTGPIRWDCERLWHSPSSSR